MLLGDAAVGLSGVSADDAIAPLSRTIDLMAYTANESFPIAAYLADPYFIDEDAVAGPAAGSTETVPPAPGMPRDADVSSGSDADRDPTAAEASDADVDSADAGDAEAIDADETGEFVSRSDYEDLAERLEALEGDWTDYQDELEEEAAEKLKKSAWKMTGRIHLDHWNFTDGDPGTNYLETGQLDEDPEDRWVFRRIRLEFAGAVPQNMIFRTQIDFNNPSSAEMKDVYLGFTNLPNNQSLLIGNQKRPIGLDHLNSSRFNFFAERPFAVETFNEDARRLGMCMYGYTDDLSINWRYGLFLLENISRTGRTIDDFDEGGIYGRLAASPWYDDISGGRGYLHVALSGSANATSDQDPNEARFRTRPLARSDSRWYNTDRIVGASNYEQIGLETILNIGAFQTTGEYIFNAVQRDAIAGGPGDDLFFHGGYLYASYYLTGEHIPYDRKSGTIGRLKPFENFFLVDRCRGGTGRGWGALGIGLRYDYIDLSDSDISGGVGHAATLGINWHWTAYSKLQTNMIWGLAEDAGQAQLNDAGSTPLVTGPVDADYSILGFRYMLDF